MSRALRGDVIEFQAFACSHGNYTQHECDTEQNKTSTIFDFRSRQEGCGQRIGYV
jgi:hypothetical protein